MAESQWLREMTRNSAIKKSGVYPRFRTIALDPLYSEDVFTYDQYLLLEGAISRNHILLDMYCSSCGKESTFKSTPYNSQTLAAREAGSTVKDQNEFSEYLTTVVLSCSRDCTMTVKMHFRVGFTSIPKEDGEERTYLRVIQKIGQFPTYADLRIPEFKHLYKELSKQDRQELNKAIGLAAHDSAIGAFVYLRRVFERLIETAHTEAKLDEKWDEDKYKGKSRMDEKVLMLKKYLPELIVTNRKLYSVLSIGIHQLTEELCDQVFEPVRNGIYAMLEEKHAKNRQDTIREELSPLLDSVLKQIEEATSDGESKPQKTK